MLKCTVDTKLSSRCRDQVQKTKDIKQVLFVKQCELLTNYRGLWEERPEDGEFAPFIKFVTSRKQRQIGHVFM